MFLGVCYPNDSSAQSFSKKIALILIWKSDYSYTRHKDKQCYFAYNIEPSKNKIIYIIYYIMLSAIGYKITPRHQNLSQEPCKDSMRWY